MAATEQMTVAIPSKLAAAIRARVTSGEFTDTDAVIVSALEDAEAHRAGIDAWLRGPVSEAYDEVMAGTATLLTIDEVRERLGLAR